MNGLSCASCVGRVERALRSVPGVLNAAVNLATGRATIELLAGTVPAADLLRAVERSGYAARLAGTRDDARAEREEARDREAARLRRKVLVAGGLTIPIVAIDMGAHFVPGFHRFLVGLVGQQAVFALLFVLASIVQFGPAGSSTPRAGRRCGGWRRT